MAQKLPTLDEFAISTRLLAACTPHLLPCPNTCSLVLSAMSSTHCSSCVMHGNTDSVLHAHISTVLSSLAVQRQSSAPVQRQWRVQSTVEDSAASEEDSEPEELPSRQTDFQSSIRRPETIDSFDVVPQLPELTRSQRVVQQQLIRLFPPVPAADADWGRGPIDSFDYTPQLPAFPKRQHSISAFLQLSIVGRDHHHLPSCGLASVATELLARSLGFPQRVSQTDYFPEYLAMCYHAHSSALFLLF